MTSVSPPPPPPPPGGAYQGSMVASPVRLGLNAPLEVENWRVIGNPILAIPHYLKLIVLIIGLGFTTFIAWWQILFSGVYPESKFNFAAGVMRYQWRVTTFQLFMRNDSPSYEVVKTLDDPGDDPATYSMVYPQNLSRGLIFVKFITAIPVFFVLAAYGIVAYVGFIIAFFTVLFTGKYPENWRDYTIRWARLQYRATAYIYLMTDVYPGFSMDE